MTTTPEHAALRSYLNDHLAGASFGLALARRLAETNRGTEVGGDLQTFAQELVEDRSEVSGLLQQLGLARDPIRQAAGVLAEQISRLRLDRRVTRNGDLSRLMELEALVAGVTAKRAMWAALREIASAEPQVAAVPLDDLLARADRQLEMLNRHRLAAARQALS